MSEIRFHETNSGKDARASFAGFEGLNMVWFVAGLGASLAVFRYVNSQLHWDLVESGAVAAIPILLVSAYVFLLKQGKPPSYDIDGFEWVAVKVAGSPYFSRRHTMKVKNPYREESDGKDS